MRVLPFGEAALLVELGREADLALNAQVHALSAALASEPFVRALIPGIASLLVEIDPAVDLEVAASAIQPRLRELAASTSRVLGRARRVPAVYGGEHGPDLDAVAARIGLAPAEVIARHTALEQVVYMLGFAPGFAYLGDLPDPLVLPRLVSPRTRVPAGSVAIAGRHTGIYPRASPGGWHLIGRSPVLLFDPEREPPAYLRPGDRVRFFAIDADAWDRYTGAPADWDAPTTSR